MLWRWRTSSWNRQLKKWRPGDRSEINLAKGAHYYLTGTAMNARAEVNKLNEQVRLKKAEQKNCTNVLRRQELQREIDGLIAQMAPYYPDLLAEEEAKEAVNQFKLNNGGRFG